jgi:hypothetical protein
MVNLYKVKLVSNFNSNIEIIMRIMINSPRWLKTVNEALGQRGAAVAFVGARVDVNLKASIAGAQLKCR